MPRGHAPSSDRSGHPIHKHTVWAGGTPEKPMLASGGRSTTIHRMSYYTNFSPPSAVLLPLNTRCGSRNASRLPKVGCKPRRLPCPQRSSGDVPHASIREQCPKSPSVSALHGSPPAVAERPSFGSETSSRSSKVSLLKTKAKAYWSARNFLMTPRLSSYRLMIPVRWS